MEVSRVNATMALEDQLAQDPHLLNDLADEMIAKNIKQIWEEYFFLCFAELLIGLKCRFSLKNAILHILLKTFAEK